MRPAENITRLIERAKIKLDPEVGRACHDELVEELEKLNAVRSRETPIRWSLIINSTIAICLVGMMVFVGVKGFNEVNDPVALLTDSIGAEWGEMEDVPVKNTVIRPGSLKLLAGLAEITFVDGAVVVVEGPAEFELVSGNNMSINSGKVYAVVPKEAVGFIVETPCAKIIDLGTEFGVSVAMNGTSELHVCKGLVSMMTDVGGSMASQVLSNGQAVSVGYGGAGIQAIGFAQNNFVIEIRSAGGKILRGESVE